MASRGAVEGSVTAVVIVACTLIGSVFGWPVGVGLFLILIFII